MAGLLLPADSRSARRARSSASSTTRRSIRIVETGVEFAEIGIHPPRGGTVPHPVQGLSGDPTAAVERAKFGDLAAGDRDDESLTRLHAPEDLADLIAEFLLRDGVP